MRKTKSPTLIQSTAQCSCQVKIETPLMVSTCPMSGLGLIDLVTRWNKGKRKRHSQCGQDVRSGPPRKGIKYAEHSDPWYTDNDETFVASPNDGTKLSVNEIIEVLKTNFYGVRCKRTRYVLYYNVRVKNNIDNLDVANIIISDHLPFKDFSESPNFIKNIKIKKIDLSSIIQLDAIESLPIKHKSSLIYYDEHTGNGILTICLDGETTTLEYDTNFICIEELIKTQIEENRSRLQNILTVDSGLAFKFLDIIGPEYPTKDIFTDLVKKIYGKSTDNFDVENYFTSGRYSQMQSKSMIIISREDETFEKEENWVMYGIFLKNAFRTLSENLKNILKDFNASDNPKETSHRIESITELQQIYSMFLAEKDFSPNEISNDTLTSNAYLKHTENISLKEQKGETEQEMSRLHNLATSLHNQAREKADSRFNNGILIVGIFTIISIGDFLYSWLSDSFDLDTSLVGTTLMATLVIISVVFYLMAKKS